MLLAESLTEQVIGLAIERVGDRFKADVVVTEQLILEMKSVARARGAITQRPDLG